MPRPPTPELVILIFTVTIAFMLLAVVINSAVHGPLSTEARDIMRDIMLLLIGMIGGYIGNSKPQPPP